MKENICLIEAEAHGDFVVFGCNFKFFYVLNIVEIGHLHDLCRNLLHMRADIFAVMSQTCKINTTVFIVLLLVH